MWMGRNEQAFWRDAILVMSELPFRLREIFLFIILIFSFTEDRRPSSMSMLCTQIPLPPLQKRLTASSMVSNASFQSCSCLSPQSVCVMRMRLCVLLQRRIKGFLLGTHKREHVSDKYLLQVTPWSYLIRRWCLSWKMSLTSESGLYTAWSSQAHSWLYHVWKVTGVSLASEDKILQGSRLRDSKVNSLYNNTESDSEDSSTYEGKEEILFCFLLETWTMSITFLVSQFFSYGNGMLVYPRTCPVTEGSHADLIWVLLIILYLHYSSVRKCAKYLTLHKW